MSRSPSRSSRGPSPASSTPPSTGSRRMSGPDPDSNGPVDEFDWIDRCLRPLAKDAPEALDLLDAAAGLPSRPRFDLVVSRDPIVEGVHFRPDDPPALIAGKLLRV